MDSPLVLAQVIVGEASFGVGPSKLWVEADSLVEVLDGPPGPAISQKRSFFPRSLGWQRPDIGLASTSVLYLDKVVEVKRDELVAIPDQNVEVGVNQRGFIALCDSKRCVPNAVNLIGFSEA